MSVASTTQKIIYQGNASATAFPVPFGFYKASEVEVWLRDESVNPPTETKLTNPTHYTLSGLASSGQTTTATVNMLAAPASTAKLLVRRMVALTQGQSYSNNSPFPASLTEQALDELTMAAQQLAEETTRAVRLPAAVDPANFDPHLPTNIAGQQSMTIVTDATGTKLAIGPSLATVGAAVPAAAAASASATAAAGSATAAAGSATSAAGSATAAAGSATAAAGSATAAAGSATASAGSATTAATAATTSINAQKGAANGIATLDASGLVPISQIPPSAIERLVVVASQAARFALTTATVQNGDTVKQADTGEFWYVVDDSNLGNSAGYSVYTAGTATQAASFTGSMVGDITGTQGATLVTKIQGTTVTGTTGTGKSVFSISPSFTSGVTILGATSGGITIAAQAAAGTYNFNLPITAGSAGQVLTSQGGGSNAMTWTSPLTNPMTTGGDIIYGGASGAATRLPNGSAGQALTSGGGTSAPSWSQIIPAGVMSPFAGTTAPSGWLACDGTAVSRTTYAALFAAISTTYGVGDGSTTFNLPNTKGVFLRGAGSQTIGGISYSATQGTTQGDQMQGHDHNYQTPNLTSDATAGSSRLTTLNTSTATSTGPVSDGTNGTPRTGTETRPANIAVLYIIKT